MLGLLVSLLLWILSVAAGYFAAAFLAKEKFLAEKWQLLVGLLIVGALYYLLRYRLALYAGDYYQVRMFFGEGSFLAPERLALFFSLPIFYVLTVLKPRWAEHPLLRLLLLLLVPFALKLICVYAGITPWQGLGEQEAPPPVL